MKASFDNRYSIPGDSSLVVDNLLLRSAAGDLPTAGTRSSGEGPLAVGFLGTLSAAKGFDLFAQVEAEVSLLDGNKTRFECAGLVADEVSTATLKQQPTIRHVGVLDSGEVGAFLDRQSLILFPSRYPNEAQPNVILEALQAGVPVVSTERGCIGDLLRPHLASLLVDEGDFVATAAALIRNLEEDASALVDLRSRAHDQYRYVADRSNLQVGEWLKVAAIREALEPDSP